MSNPRVPTTAVAITLAGAIPFVGLAISLWVVPPAYRQFALQAITMYAAVILASLGGAQWGLAVAVNDTAPQSARSMFLLSIIPCLLAWVMLFLPVSGARLIVAMFLFGFVWLIDALLHLQKLIPAWFFRLRSLISLIVIGSLSVALLAV